MLSNNALFTKTVVGSTGHSLPTPDQDNVEKEGKNMTKSELIERIVTHQGLLSSKDVELAIKTMLEQMSQCLATGDYLEKY